MTTDVLPPPVREALDSGNKLEAIKRLRAITGLGLKEAKDWIEHHERSASASSTEAHFSAQIPAALSAHARKGLSPGEVARGGGANKWLALAALGALAVLVALFYR
jgi:hypothetical protein